MLDNALSIRQRLTTGDHEDATMDRRKFLKTTGTFIAGATVARSALAHAATEPGCPGTAGSAFESELAI